MPDFSKSRTLRNLKNAFSTESAANRRYLFFAHQADIEGRPDVAGIFRHTAEGETGHAFGHLEYIMDDGDPATGLPIGDSRQNLQSAMSGELHESAEMYPGFARIAREEGFDEIAEWFETLARAERSHAARFEKALREIDNDNGSG